MQIGIVGHPGSGVTTIFNAVSAGRAPVGSYRGGGGDGANRAVVKVPDARVDAFTAMFAPKSTVFATVEYVDIPHPP